jgi:GH35 family endo-1,4-beta-xylanase
MAHLRTATLLLAITASLAPLVSAAELSDAELLAGADGRIDRHRKAEATVRVIDASGKAVAGAKVSIEQTRHAFLFGCNIFSWGRLDDPNRESAYRQRFAELLNYATLPFYWPMYEPRRGEPQHAHAEQVARWCRQQGILSKGHPLAWNFADPAWLPNDSDAIRRLQMARIDDCVSRFAGLIDRWDVVNEATDFERAEFVKGDAPKMSAMWQKTGRMEFTRECFAHARKANPKAILVINDYRTDPAYERVVEQLVDSKGNRMYDVIGIQSHMHGGTWSTRQIWNVCQRFARFGVPLHFTETTILSGERKWDDRGHGGWPSTPDGEAYQAQEVVRFYTVLFSHPAVQAITWWDFSDAQAWKGAPAGLVRKDMSPKPAYRELRNLVKGKWWTRAAAETAADGIATFRGFLGEYTVTASVPGKDPVRQPFRLAPGTKNSWTIRLL